MKETMSNPAPRVGRGRIARHGERAGGQGPELAAVAPKLTKLFATKIITPKPPATDAASLHKERLLSGLLAAQSPSAITAAADAIFAAGHAVPDEQEYHLQILEHADDGCVLSAIETLASLLGREPARRRPLLEQRLHRIEDSAEEPATRAAAATLRRNLR